MLHNDDQRARKVRERAFMLADSGLHEGWRTVEKTLIGEGWPNSRAVLGSDYLRLAIDERCTTARTRHHA